MLGIQKMWAAGCRCLDERQGELRVRAHIVEIDVGVVLPQQPDGQVLPRLSDRPKRFASTHDMNFCADDAVDGEEVLLELLVATTPTLIELICADTGCIDLHPLTDH